MKQVAPIILENQFPCIENFAFYFRFKISTFRRLPVLLCPQGTQCHRPELRPGSPATTRALRLGEGLRDEDLAHEALQAVGEEHRVDVVVLRRWCEAGVL